MNLRIIRKLWLVGNAAALVSLVLPQPAGLIVMGAADVVLAVAWAWAIGRALVTGHPKWAGLIAVLPLVMWGYIFGLAEPEPQLPEQPAAPAPPPTVPSWAELIRPADGPLVLRQAREVVREAQRRHPEW